MRQPLLHIQSLYFSHPQRTLWQGWSADLYPGVTLLRGDDGSGKTTLLRLLAGDLAAQQGRLVVAVELGNGVVMGLPLRLAMLAVDFHAESLSMHAGFSFAQTVAPDAALPSTVIGELLGMSVLASLFLADVHLLFIERLGQSLVAVPLGTWPSAWDATAVLGLMGTAFSIGLVMSCGSFALYLFANFTLGMINRISPQLNLMSVGFSVTAPLALVVIALVVLQLPVLAEIIASAALRFVDQGLLNAR